MKPIVVSESPISLSALKVEIDKIKKRDTELNFRAVKVDEYLQTFPPLGPKHSAELREKIEKLDVPRIKEEQIVKIMDIMPKTVEAAENLFSGSPITISKENLKKIVDVVKEYV